LVKIMLCREWILAICIGPGGLGDGFVGGETEAIAGAYR
jgi:hypothetical protein